MLSPHVLSGSGEEAGKQGEEHEHVHVHEHAGRDEFGNVIGGDRVRDQQGQAQPMGSEGRGAGSDAGSENSENRWIGSRREWDSKAIM